MTTNRRVNFCLPPEVLRFQQAASTSFLHSESIGSQKTTFARLIPTISHFQRLASSLKEQSKTIHASTVEEQLKMLQECGEAIKKVDSRINVSSEDLDCGLMICGGFFELVK